MTGAGIEPAQHPAAIEHLEQAQVISQDIGDRHLRAEALDAPAETLADQGEAAYAERYGRQARDIYTDSAHPRPPRYAHGFSS
jgi:hypothetical protein